MNYNDRIEYLNHAHDVRGRIINAIAEMEQIIDWYIADHFCSKLEKRRELMDVIISTKHLTFQAKAEIIKCLVERNGHTTKKEANKMYDALVSKIAANRNVLAHCSLHDTVSIIKGFKDDKEKTVYFLKYLNDKKVIPFGKKEVREILDLTMSVRAVLMTSKSPTSKFRSTT
jgi:hypothetical protein